MTNLIFQKLEIENFKSFSNTHFFKLNRTPGLYYISGRNKLNPELGANGVGKSSLWDALTWVLFGKTGRDNRPGESIVPWGEEKKTTTVWLLFSKNNFNHQLVRKRNPNSLQLDGETIEQSQVEKILGISEEMFRRSIVLAQFGTLFMDMSPEQQSKMFTDALNLNIWLKASELSRAKSRESEKALADLTGTLERSKGKLTGFREAITEAKASLETCEQGQAQALEALRAEKANITESLESSLSKARLRALEGLRGGLNEGEVRALAKNLIKAATISPTSSSKELPPKETLKEEWRAIEKALREAENLQTKSEAEQKRLGIILKDIKAKIAAYSAPTKLCPECGAEISKKQASEKLVVLTKNMNDYLHNIEVIDKNIIILNLAVGQLDQSTGLYADSIDLAGRLEEIKEKIQDIKKDNPYKKQLIELKEKRDSLKDYIQTQEDVITCVTSEKAQYEYWVDAFKQIRMSIIDQVLIELSMATTRHVESLGLKDWEIKFSSERENKSGTVSISFTVMLYPPNSKTPIKWESYSGGESQRWQLAIAFGLSEIVLGRVGVLPNLEVLDEPTRGLSPEGINDLLECLQTRAEELQRSIFVTEHHSLERGNFNKTIMIEKDQQGSRIREL